MENHTALAVEEDIEMLTMKKHKTNKFIEHIEAET